ncbi:MAG: phosphotransferase family protein [Chloroflexota bacterium]|nr:phosphotransferase family protein [Chloroflexota bacterium]
MTPDEELTSRIETFIARQTGAAAVRVSDLRRLTGGASRETWSLDALLDRPDGSSEQLPLILQRDVRGAPKELSRPAEFALMRAAFDEGVPAPEPMWIGDGSIGSGESFFVRRVDGETLPRRLLREDVYAEARDLMPEQLGRALAQIHRIDPKTHGLISLPAPPDGIAPAAYEVQRYEQIFRTIALEPHPAFELAFRWLHANSKQQAADSNIRALVHGDFRIGNMLFGPDGLRLVLDWELAHIGDPMEDMGFICVRSWRFGGPKPVGGIGDREPFFAAYEAAGGGKVDPERVRFWEVFGNLRWGVICLSQARTYIDGISNSVELASIGRRTAETEWELLELVG